MASSAVDPVSQLTLESIGGGEDDGDDDDDELLDRQNHARNNNNNNKSLSPLTPRRTQIMKSLEMELPVGGDDDDGDDENGMVMGQEQQQQQQQQPVSQLTLESIGEDAEVLNLPPRQKKIMMLQKFEIEQSSGGAGKGDAVVAGSHHHHNDNDDVDDDDDEKPELPLWYDVCGDWVATIIVGALVVSYWRGR